MARLVKTHSTYIKGLIALLKEMGANEHIDTITPGVIKVVKSNCQRLELRITRITTSGYKLIARKGRMAQDVFITTTLKEEELKIILEKLDN